ncbi:MAG TPA: hypothetical protein VHA13_01385 [Gammaproteobacteria bacterium]|nr:hypothetical protein [Gammaproteobacteria bacterium]
MNPRKIKKLLRRANELKKEGRTDKAETLIKTLIEKNPSSNLLALKALKHPAKKSIQTNNNPTIVSLETLPNINVVNQNTVSSIEIEDVTDEKPETKNDSASNNSDPSKVAIKDVSYEEKESKTSMPALSPTNQTQQEEKTSSGTLSDEVKISLGIRFLFLMTGDELNIGKENFLALGDLLLALIQLDSPNKGLSLKGNATTLPTIGEALIKNKHKLGDFTKNIYGIKNENNDPTIVGLNFLASLPRQHPYHRIQVGSMAIAQVLDTFVDTLKIAAPNKPLWKQFIEGETEDMRRLRESIFAGPAGGTFFKMAQPKSYVASEGPTYTDDQLKQLNAFNLHTLIPKDLPNAIVNHLKQKEYAKASRLCFEMLKSNQLSEAAGSAMMKYMLDVLIKYDEIDESLYQEKNAKPVNSNLNQFSM